MAMKGGVRVNTVAPGPVWTPLIPSTLPDDSVRNFGADTSFERAAQPDPLRNRRVDEVVEAPVAEDAQHELDVVLPRADVARDELPPLETCRLHAGRHEEPQVGPRGPRLERTDDGGSGRTNEPPRVRAVPVQCNSPHQSAVSGTPPW